MTYPFPTRSAGDSAALHVADHNELQARLGINLPSVTTGSTGHLAHQSKVHRVLDTILAQTLPVGLTTSSTGHLSHHNIIGALLNAEIHGPRGPVGQIADVTSIAGYPGAFTDTLSAGPTSITDAIAANGTGAKFLLQPGTYALFSTCNPKSGQEFWCQNGVTIVRGGSTNPAFVGSNATPNVKIMNAKFEGFNALGGAGDITINIADADGWQIGHCDISGTWLAITPQANSGSTSANHRIHNCYLHDNAGSTWEARRAVDTIWEDNEFFNNGTAGGTLAQHKHVLCKRNRVRHNYFHEIKAGPAIWHDTANTECIVEWNRLEGAAVNNSRGMDFEQDCYAWDNQLAYNTQAEGQIARYNKVSGFNDAGILLNPTRWAQVYGNILEDNGLDGNWGQIHQFIAAGHISKESHPGTAFGIDCRMEFNSIHHNYISPNNPNVHRAVVTNCTSVYEDGTPFDRTNYVNNQMQNNYNFNGYDASVVGPATTQWTWMDTLKTYTTWKQVPQVNGTGAFQDINSTRD